MLPLLFFRSWSRGQKASGQGQGHKKNPRLRPRTAFPRTDPLEAKDRNDRGHGLGPRTQAHVSSKKKVFKNFFSGDLQHFNNSKKSLFSSRGQGNFRRLEASRPRPRTSKCVLEDVLEAKDVLEDSTSVY